MSTERQGKRISSVRLDDLRAHPDRVTKLASRDGGVRVMDGDREAFRLVIPSKPLTE